MHHNPAVVAAFWRESGISTPLAEFKFHPERKWRFDFAWPEQKVAVEVQGGIHGTGKRCRLCKQSQAGRHTRGAALKKEWEKLNTAAGLGWRILYCEPREVLQTDFARQLKAALEFLATDEHG